MFSAPGLTLFCGRAAGGGGYGPRASISADSHCAAVDAGADAVKARDLAQALRAEERSSKLWHVGAGDGLLCACKRQSMG